MSGGQRDASSHGAAASYPTKSHPAGIYMQPTAKRDRYKPKSLGR